MQEPALSENLRNARKAAGLTQQALADKSGKSIRTVQLIESGDGGSTLSTVHALATALGISASELLSPTDAKAAS